MRIPSRYTIGDESHQLIETTPALNIAGHGYASNHLDAHDSNIETTTELRRRFGDRVRDGKASVASRFRMLERRRKIPCGSRARRWASAWWLAGTAYGPWSKIAAVQRAGPSMKLQFPFIQLPLAFDADVLSLEIDAIEESNWRPHPSGLAGNSMLPLVAVDGDPANEAFSGPMRPTPYLLRCPYLSQVLGSVGAVIGRSRLMRLAGQAEVARHADQGYYWAERVRIHVPITTQPTVRFECGDAAVNMAAGECWIFDTWRQHRVLNDAEQSRVHLVADSVGGVRFWEHVGKGRPHPGPQDPGWRPQLIAPAGDAVVGFPCESANVPVVMTPWELGSHLGFLFGESLPHANAKLLQQLASKFMREWHMLWAEHGDAEAGPPLFKHAYDVFADAVDGPSQDVQLKNGMQWRAVLQTMIGKVAVSMPETEPLSEREKQRAFGDNA
jgi:hypothetical protein